MVVVGSQNFGVICGFHFHVWGKTDCVGLALCVWFCDGGEMAEEEG